MQRTYKHSRLKVRKLATLLRCNVARTIKKKKMETIYNISLDKTSKKFTCPGCGKNTFVRYFNFDTNEYLPEHVGRCDREQNCNYHYTPKQYFTENGIKNDIPKKVIQSADSLIFQFSFDEIIKDEIKQLSGCKWNAEQKYWYIENNIISDEVKEFAQRNNFLINKYTPPKQPSYLDKNLLLSEKYKDDKTALQRNNFLIFLKSIFQKETIKFLYSHFLIGTYENKTVFWQIDNNTKIRAGKIIEYNTNGKRTQNINWIHKLENIKDFNLNQCLFGLHNVEDDNKIIGIVESEKTAIIMTGLGFERAIMPNYVWLATGQKYMLKCELLEPLKNRKIVLFPDTGKKYSIDNKRIKTPFEAWSDKLPELHQYISKNIAISDLLEQNTTDEQKKQGLDIADFVIMQLQKQAEPTELIKELSKTDQKFNFLLKKNSNLMKLVDTFKCVDYQTNRPYTVVNY